LTAASRHDEILSSANARASSKNPLDATNKAQGRQARAEACEQPQPIGAASSSDDSLSSCFWAPELQSFRRGVISAGPFRFR
jgi:hypothetical protein